MKERVFQSHAYFNMAYINLIGNGTAQNTTRFYEYLDNALKTFEEMISFHEEFFHQFLVQ